MKGDFEAAMTAFGEKMGVATAVEAMHCLVAFAGIALAIVFCVMGITMHPSTPTAVDATAASAASQPTAVLTYSGKLS